MCAQTTVKLSSEAVGALCSGSKQIQQGLPPTPASAQAVAALGEAGARWFDAKSLAASATLATKHFGEAMRSSDRAHWIKAIQAELSIHSGMDCCQLLARSDVPPGVCLLGLLGSFNSRSIRGYHCTERSEERRVQ